MSRLLLANTDRQKETFSQVITGEALLYTVAQLVQTHSDSWL